MSLGGRFINSDWPLFADENLEITQRRHRAIARDGFMLYGPKHAHMPIEKDILDNLFR